MLDAVIQERDPFLGSTGLQIETSENMICGAQVRTQSDRAFQLGLGLLVPSDSEELKAEMAVQGGGVRRDLERLAISPDGCFAPAQAGVCQSELCQHHCIFRLQSLKCLESIDRLVIALSLHVGLAEEREHIRGIRVE